MKVWKSPIFYFGLLLLIAVTGAMAAPFVIDWNAYRADLENYGRKLTGRTVNIDGAISVRLFPWPRLTADNVRLAGPPGREPADFASAQRITVRVTLAGLFNGQLHVESVDIEEPSITIERQETGEGNWTFTPAADLAKSELLAQVKLDRVNLRNGRLKLIDHRRGGEHQIEKFNAALSAPGITGPWRMRASASYRDRPLDISVNTGAWQTDAPFRFGLRISPRDGSGLVYGFDGANEGNKLKGVLRIEPAAALNDKADSEGKVRPLVFKSAITADFDTVALDKIEVAPRDPKDGGVMMTGSARLMLGVAVTASAELTASRVDLDELGGAAARKLLREGGGLALVDGLLAGLPERIDLNAALKVTSLKAGGQLLENVLLRIGADSNAIRVRELSASLPGRSRALFKGVFFPGKEGAELAGSLALESGDLRQLALWAWPEGAGGIAAMWTGSRGHLKLQTDVSLSDTSLHFNKSEYEIDGARGSGELTVTRGGREAIDLRLDARGIDLDTFMPQGIAAVSSGGKTGIAGLLAFLAPRAGSGDLRFTLQAGTLRLNGVEAEDVAIDLVSGAKGLDLRMLEIGAVGGAKLQASGLILDAGEGPDGSISVEAEAQDARGLLRLLGLLPADAEPAWAAALGPASINGSLALKPGALGPLTSFELEGKAGALELSASGSVTASDKMDLRGVADIRSTSSAGLVRLAGLEPTGGDALPGRLTVTAAGSLRDGFTADIQAQAYGTRADYNGRIDFGEGGLNVSGEAGARATDTGPLFAALGLPATVSPGGVLLADAKIASEKGVIRIDPIDGRLGDAKFAGDLRLEGRNLTGNIEMGETSLTDVLAATFLSWSGGAPRLDRAFAEGLPFGLTGEVWIKPSMLQVHRNFAVSDVQIGITASADEIRLAVFGKARDGRDAKIEIGSRRNGDSRGIDAKVTLPVDLEKQLLLAGGEAVASGEGRIDLRFTGEGRSAGGVLAAMSGSGSFSFQDVRLRNISPAAFTRKLAEATDKSGLDGALAGLLGGEGLAAGDISGSIEIANGVAQFQPFDIKTPDADATVKTVAEIGQGLIDTAVTLRLKARPNLPPVEISYVGEPDALTRNESSSELAAQLGLTLMEQGVKELERLQKEQQRLALEEERMRQEDEAKLQAYYAQRDEIRLRQRELKIHAEMRVVAAEKLKIETERLRLANIEINKREMSLRARELRVHRRMAKLEQAPAPPARVRPPPKRQRATVIRPPSQ